MPIYWPSCLSLGLSSYLSSYLASYLSVYPSIYLFCHFPLILPIYIYIYIHTCIHTYTYISIYIHMFIYTRIFTCIFHACRRGRGRERERDRARGRTSKPHTHRQGEYIHPESRQHELVSTCRRTHMHRQTETVGADRPRDRATYEHKIMHAMLACIVNPSQRAQYPLIKEYMP